MNPHDAYDAARDDAYHEAELREAEREAYDALRDRRADEYDKGSA